MSHRPSDFALPFFLSILSVGLGTLLCIQFVNGVAYGKAGSHPTYLAEHPVHFWISLGFQFLLVAMMMGAAIFVFCKVRKL